jgi:hypothetical protein
MPHRANQINLMVHGCPPFVFLLVSRGVFPFFRSHAVSRTSTGVFHEQIEIDCAQEDVKPKKPERKED